MVLSFHSDPFLLQKKLKNHSHLKLANRKLSDFSIQLIEYIFFFLKLSFSGMRHFALNLEFIFMNGEELLCIYI